MRVAWPLEVGHLAGQAQGIHDGVARRPRRGEGGFEIAPVLARDAGHSRTQGLLADCGLGEPVEDHVLEDVALPDRVELVLGELALTRRFAGALFVDAPTHDQAEALTLADRIVVMKDGVIQQIGNPDDVYERPRNMFVASFLGNPAINYLEGTIDRGGAAPVFRRGACRSRCRRSLPRAFAAPEGQELVLGIAAGRRFPAAEAASGMALSGVVDSVLPVGSDRFIGLKV